MDLTRRPAGKWIVDFGWTMSKGDAALYEEPFRWVKEHVLPMRQQNRRAAYREYWWRHVEPRQGMWGALAGLSRYIATPTVAKHRLFAWVDARVCPDQWLNPPEWVEWVDVPVPGYPKQPVPRDEDAVKALKKRTLTNLYNARPQWLADAHTTLDTAVAAAYGWPTDVSDDDALRELLVLNLGNH